MADEPRIARLDDLREFIKPFRVEPGRKVRLPKDFDPGYCPDDLNKKDASTLLAAGRRAPRGVPGAPRGPGHVRRCWSCSRRWTPPGKDGTIKHVMSGVNPQGVEVSSFKVPSERGARPRLPVALREADARPRHDRHLQPLLLRGDARRPRPQGDPRSASTCPASAKGDDVWTRRFREINDWERYLTDNGIRIVKLFLNVSPEEQKRAVHAPDRRPRAQLEVLAGRHPRARALGRLPEGVRGGADATPAPSRRRGT